MALASMAMIPIGYSAHQNGRRYGGALFRNIVKGGINKELGDAHPLIVSLSDSYNFTGP